MARPAYRGKAAGGGRADSGQISLEHKLLLNYFLGTITEENSLVVQL
jgi:hypothetical protein